MTAPPPALNVAAITTRQRQALAWYLRDLLHGADRRAADGRSPGLSDYMRGEILSLISQLEGARRLATGLDDGEVA
jgi:hypothetical protein